jgi:hypothetical protein
MIQSPGAYHFVDYQKLGIPFEICLNVFQVLCLYFIDVPEITIPLAFVFLVFCIVIDHVFVERNSVRSLTLFHPRNMLSMLRAFGQGLLSPLRRRSSKANASPNTVPSSSSSFARPFTPKLEAMFQDEEELVVVAAHDGSAARAGGERAGA